MLSAAKHLLLLLKSKEKQILRSALHDINGQVVYV